MIIDSWHWRQNAPERAVERIMRLVAGHGVDLYVYLIGPRTVVMDEFDTERLDCCIVTVSSHMSKSTILARLMEGCAIAAGEDEDKPVGTMRERIRRHLAQQPATCGELAEALNLTNRASLDATLYAMKRDGSIVLTDERDGQMRKYAIRNERQEAA